jgi:hypothetical protein
MSATKVEITTEREKSRAETIEQFLSRGGRIERIEAYPDPEGRVLLRGARNRRFQSMVLHVPARRPS